MTIRCSIRLLLVLYLVLVLRGQADAQVGKLYPSDEGARDPSFLVFRARLLEAMQKRDLPFVLSILSPSIKNSFGGDDGIDGFKKLWKPEQRDSEFWDTFVSVVGLGGSFDKEGRFLAPYVYSKFPDNLDAFTHAAVIGESVRVRKEPGLDSAVIGTLSFDIVKVTNWSPKLTAGTKEKWVMVSLRDGSVGYTAETYLRSPVGYRAGFEKKDGKWMLTFFVAGD